MSERIRRQVQEKRPNEKVYLPAPEEIEACCLKIQSTWSQREVELRRVDKPSQLVETHLISSDFLTAHNLDHGVRQIIESVR